MPTISCSGRSVPWPGALVANAPSPSSASQASFPANLQLVLVLRPTGFFQRTLSDIAFKFNRDDFKMKVPVSAEPVPLVLLTQSQAEEHSWSMVNSQGVSSILWP